MFEGYLDRSAEAKHKGRDESHALCICRFGKDVPDWQFSPGKWVRRRAFRWSLKA